MYAFTYIIVGYSIVLQLQVRITNYDLYKLHLYKLQVHVVIPLATCLRNGYAIPLGYAEFSVLKEVWVKMGLLRVS